MNVHRSGAVTIDLAAETVKKVGASWIGTIPGPGIGSATPGSSCTTSTTPRSASPAKSTTQTWSSCKSA